MREETEFRPKPMVMIGERPILWHIMKIYDHYEFRNFTLCLGYKAEMIRDYFLDYRTHTRSTRVALRSGKVEYLGDASGIEDWSIALIDTGLDSLTGRRARRRWPLSMPSGSCSPTVTASPTSTSRRCLRTIAKGGV